MDGRTAAIVEDRGPCTNRWTLATACSQVVLYLRRKTPPVSPLGRVRGACADGHSSSEYRASPRLADIQLSLQVAKWAKENANLMEPTSLGRPHFRYVDAQEKHGQIAFY